MKKFYIVKESRTFADSLECFGLSRVLKMIIIKISGDEDDDLLIEDKGCYFELTSDVDILEEDMTKHIGFLDLMPYVSKKNEDVKNLQHSFINYDNEKEINDNFYKLKGEERKNSQNSPRPDYDIIRLYSGMDSCREFFRDLRKFNNNNFSKLLSYIFKYYTSESGKRNDVIGELSEFMKKEGIKIKNVNALQEINPDKGKGANRTKADSIRPEAYKNMIWLRQLIRFIGGWQGMISKYFNKDHANYSIVPRKVYVDYMNTVFIDFKKSIYGKISVQTDILMLLNLTEKLILHHEDYYESWNLFMPSHVISGLQFAYYKNLGQKPAVTNIGFLGIPDFITLKNKMEADKWLNILNEHQERIRRIDGKHSSNIKMLQNYRDFISIANFGSFFEFSYNYAKFLIFSIHEGKYRIKPFSITNMEELMKSDEKFEAIFSNEGFKAIANAIRNSTIVPIIHGNKKDIVFGLSNKLRIASRNKSSLVTEISEFIQKYNEYIMLKNYHDEIHNKYVTTKDLEEFYKLLDSDNSSQVITGMLVAFGYANNSKTEGSNE